MVDAALPDRYNTKIALDLQKSVKQKDFSYTIITFIEK